MSHKQNTGQSLGAPNEMPDHLKQIAADTESAARAVEGLTDKFELLAKALEKPKEEAKGLAERIEAFQNAIKPGKELAEAGSKILDPFKDALNSASLLQTELSKFNALGFGDAVSKQVMDVAQRMGVLGSSVADNIGLIRQLTTMTGNIDTAKELAPIVAETKAAFQFGLGVEKGDQLNGMIDAALKVAEARGALTDPKTGEADKSRTTKVMDDIVKNYAASGGTLKPQDFLDMLKNSGVAGVKMSDEVLFKGMSHFMQKNGGAATGTNVMAMFNDMLVGKMSPELAGSLNKAHLLNAKSIHRGKGGKIDSVDPMGIVGADEFKSNPFQWVNDVLIPQLKKQGLSGDKLDMKLGAMFGVKDYGGLVGQFATDQKAAEQYSGMVNRAKDVKGLREQGEESYNGQLAEFKETLEGMMTEIGKDIMPMVTDALKTVNPLLKDMLKVMRENPGAVKALAASVAGLGIALMVAGKVAMLRGALGLLHGETAKLPQALQLARSAMGMAANTVSDGWSVMKDAVKEKGAAAATAMRSAAGKFLTTAKDMLARGGAVMGNAMKQSGQFLGQLATRTGSTIKMIGQLGMRGVGQIGALIRSVGPLGATAAVAAAAFAGWELGTWLYNTYLAGTKFSDWLGNLIAKFLSWFGSSEAKEALEANEAAKKRSAEMATKLAGHTAPPPKLATSADPARNISMPPRSEGKGNAALPPAVADGGNAYANAGGGAMPIYVTLANYMDSKEISRHLISTTSQGTSGMNLKAMQFGPNICPTGM